MGYSEIACRLCGVSFNMGRRRLRSEPEWMGWENTGDGVRVGCHLGRSRNPNWCGNDDPSEEEDEASASEGVCENMDGVDIDRIDADVEKMLDGRDDDDYQYEKSDEEEPMEYDSDDEMCSPEEISRVDIVDAVEDNTYTLFKHALWSLPEPGTEKADPPAKHDCFRGKGYNGKSITAEEMRDSNLNKVVEEDTAVPFHPTCFDIFCRLSRKHFGHINVDALGEWIFDPHNPLEVDRVSSDPNVRSSSSQWWDHLDGCEYLSANPLLIPRLAPMLQAAIEKDDRFDPRDGAFDVPTGDNRGDAFSRLPLELRLQTLSYLNSSDIANLRLTSRTFRQLPILLWRDLLLKEMPYLWEVWSDDLPFMWATVQFEDVEQHQKVEAETAAWRARTENIIRESLPEALDAWKQHVDGFLSQRYNTFLEKGRAEALKEIVTGLPASKTNWYKVYTDITTNWNDLKGLQNRKRIWKDIGVIVDQLDKFTVPA
ncbi:hypothetical protein N0V95_009325 [Ascochyta clinopodiicola]|nr:hypothetical protein N0V95_009325 [Ascochyta clinopodiicola]